MTAGETGAALWLLVAGVGAFSLLWMLSLVPFTLALVLRPKRPRGAAVPLAGARAVLLALNGPDRPYRLTPLSEARLRLDWDPVDRAWAARFARVKLSAVYRAWFYLHEPRHEVRAYESIRSTTWFVGLEGWRLRLRWSWGYVGGWLSPVWAGRAYGLAAGFPPHIVETRAFRIDTTEVTEGVEAAANGVGWRYRPVPLPFEATAWGARLGEALTPPFMRGWSQKRFWGVLYAVSLAGITGSALAFVPWTGKNLGVLALVLGSILGVQALIVRLRRGMEPWSARKRTRRR